MKGIYIQTLLLSLLLTISLSAMTKNSQFLQKSNNFQAQSEFSSIHEGCTTAIFHDLFPKNSDKYIIEEHNTTTSDGYILRLFRVNLSDKYKQNLPENLKPNTEKVILIVHGLTDSSDSWFYNGEEASIGFYLVNKGYDVWLGNNRGNKYSHSHIDPNISESDFFTFSWDEMGLYDVPAFYNHVLTTTKKDKLIYFGHSQGTSQMFVAGLDSTTKNMITQKTEKYFALAPVVFLNNCGSNMIKFASVFGNFSYAASTIFPIQEFAPATCDTKKYKIFTQLAQWTCDHFKILCDNIIPGFNFDEKVDNALDNLDKLHKHLPSGASLKCVAKYAQGINSWDKQVFQKFDYGFVGNLFKYKQTTAPKWNVPDWDIDTVLIGGTRDEFASPVDVTNLSAKLKIDKTKTYWMDNWDHYTFALARNIQPLFDILEKEL